MMSEAIPISTQPVTRNSVEEDEKSKHEKSSCLQRFLSTFRHCFRNMTDCLDFWCCRNECYNFCCNYKDVDDDEYDDGCYIADEAALTVISRPVEDRENKSYEDDQGETAQKENTHVNTHSESKPYEDKVGDRHEARRPVEDRENKFYEDDQGETAQKENTHVNTHSESKPYEDKVGDRHEARNEDATHKSQSHSNHSGHHVDHSGNHGGNHHHQSGGHSGGDHSGGDHSGAHSGGDYSGGHSGGGYDGGCGGDF